MANLKNNSYLVAGAIILVGILVAVGVLVSKNKTPSGNDTGHNNTESSVISALNISPVTENDHIVGNLDADLTIVEYSDTECPFCKQFHGVLQEVMDAYKDTNEVAWVYRHFPLVTLHTKAPLEAAATECAAELGGNDGFWNYINKIYEITPSNNGLDLLVLPDIAEEIGLDRDAFIKCQDSEKYTDKIKSSFQEARDAGGTGTPFSILTLNTPMSDKAFSSISNLAQQFRPGAITLSEDKKRVALSGGLQFEAIDGLIRVMLDKSAATTTNPVQQ